MSLLYQTGVTAVFFQIIYPNIYYVTKISIHVVKKNNNNNKSVIQSNKKKTPTRPSDSLDLHTHMQIEWSIYTDVRAPVSTHSILQNHASHPLNSLSSSARLSAPRVTVAPIHCEHPNEKATSEIEFVVVVVVVVPRDFSHAPPNTKWDS